MWIEGILPWPLTLPCVGLCGSDQQFTVGQRLPAELNEHRWAVFQGRNQSKHSLWPTDTLVNIALVSCWGFRAQPGDETASRSADMFSSHIY